MTEGWVGARLQLRSSTLVGDLLGKAWKFAPDVWFRISPATGRRLARSISRAASLAWGLGSPTAPGDETAPTQATRTSAKLHKASCKLLPTNDNDQPEFLPNQVNFRSMSSSVGSQVNPVDEEREA